MGEKIGRNDPCPCGSGLKYKHCCGQDGSQASSSGTRNRVVLVILLGLGVVGAIAAFRAVTAPPSPNEWASPGVPAPNAGVQVDPSSGLYSQPPGPAPPGKVWSGEHGHWHDASGTAAPILPGPEPSSSAGSGTRAPSNPEGPLPDPVTGLYPEPPGPVPPGKVWSSEHGHWHNASGQSPSAPAGQQPASAGSSTRTANPSGLAPDPDTGLYPQPPGPVPPGKVWSPEHGHWHNEPANLAADDPATRDEDVPLVSGTPDLEETEGFSAPPGPAPPGKVWAPEHGHWHNAPDGEEDQSLTVEPIEPAPAPEVTPSENYSSD